MINSETVNFAYNIILDVSCLVNYPIKFLAMYIVFRHSPKEMGALPYFLLYIMAWNLLANIFGGLLHVHRQFPALCCRIDGIIRLITCNEYVAHVFFAAIFGCIISCVVAVPAVFPYRYLAVAHPTLLDRVEFHAPAFYMTNCKSDSEVSLVKNFSTTYP
ncbi:hypothetical protein QR680_015613 [Steinernema hermaphroditum]|uniref:Uncharacterized protein n=1 Tax=Steinernema hermaphroditum TaxID=289476 RepID=A0AA39H8P3_9BILA|nr:hypothetical protein QR680_015613 [Steinernema hermaphroditum]